MIKEAISLSKKINNERKLLIMARTKKNVENATPACKTEEVATEVKTKKAKVIDPQKTSYDVTMWFTQPLLGSAPGDPDIYKKFIASKAPDAPTKEEELLTNTVENVAAKGTNVFLRRSVTGIPCVGSHTIKGFYKESITATKRQDGGVSVTSHKSKIVGNTTITPIFVNLEFPEELIKDCTEKEFKKDGFGHYSVVRFPKEGRFQKHVLPTCDRPLQADTPQGKITSIASSEMAPAGTVIRYTLTVDKLNSDPIDEALIQTILRGIDHGTGQWRGSQEYGSFVAEIRNSVTGEMIANNTEDIIGCTSDDPEFLDNLNAYIEETCL